MEGLLSTGPTPSSLKGFLVKLVNGFMELIESHRKKNVKSIFSNIFLVSSGGHLLVFFCFFRGGWGREV